MRLKAEGLAFRFRVPGPLKEAGQVSVTSDDNSGFRI